MGGRGSFSAKVNKEVLNGPISPFNSNGKSFVGQEVMPQDWWMISNNKQPALFTGAIVDKETEKAVHAVSDYSDGWIPKSALTDKVAKMDYKPPVEKIKKTAKFHSPSFGETVDMKRSIVNELKSRGMKGSDVNVTMNISDITKKAVSSGNSSALSKYMDSHKNGTWTWKKISNE